ncbi:MAG: isocitrate lyase/PEP mutase family protein, partial [Nocardioidaceae bacterium]
AQAVDIPVIADCDTGYGNPLNVGRTVRDFEYAGVAGLFIEDQISPKRCGHFQGKTVVATDEMVQKIRAAVDARQDPDLLLVVRTDAAAVSGIEDAVSRARTYVAAGAEMLFVEAPQSRAELEYVAAELAPLSVPLMVNLVEGGRTPLLPVGELARLGFRLVSFSGSMQKTAIKAMQGLLSSLRESGGVDDYYPSQMVSLDERSEILGLPDFFALERRYAH